MGHAGILTTEQFLQAEREGKMDHRHTSLALLDLGDQPAEEQVRIFEAICFRLRFSNGTFRTTFKNRFDDVNAAVLQWMRKLFSKEAPLQVEDRAASTCLTSAEWAGPLLLEFPQLSFEASDLLLFLVEASQKPEEAFVLEPSGAPLQYIHPPRVLPLGVRESRIRLANNLRIARLRPRLEDIQIPKDWSSRRNSESVQSGAWRFRQIPLTHPLARQMERDPRFRMALGSVFDRKGGRTQVLRTMNILNPGYFSKEQLADGVQAAWESLAEGGLWVAGRTTEQPPYTNHASLFKKSGSRFELLEKIGDGWEWENLALNRG